jgi:hypothetical protein
MEHSEHRYAIHLTWLMILMLLVFILAKDFLAYYVVGDLGQPAWDFRPVKDLPGESAYAVYPNLPFPQHVKGQKGE